MSVHMYEEAREQGWMFFSTSLCIISLTQGFSLNHLGQQASRNHLGLPAPNSRVTDIGSQAWIFIAWALGIQTHAHTASTLTYQPSSLTAHLKNSETR